MIATLTTNFILFLKNDWDTQTELSFQSVVEL
jgi:hypothetical protein